MRYTPLLALAVLLAGQVGAASARASDDPQSMTRATFAESKEAFPNPERGFYRAAPGYLEQLDAAFLDGAYRDGYRLIYARINLEPYRNRPLPPAFLDKLEAGFAAARHAGVKLIVRPVYNYPHGETDYHSAQDAPLPLVLHHIEQLKPVLRSNADVIAFVQAGFVGAWGEWHTSSNGLAETGPRTAIKDALLAALPADRFVQFRYPPYIREWMPQLPGADAPRTGMRIGFHNDCFMASTTDVGTYSEDARARAAEQDYTDRLGDVAPFGGETCNPADEGGATPRTACAYILREGARYNLTYLNDGYYRRIFHDNWIAGGCYEEVAGRMGYRLRLLDAAHRGRVTPGETFELTVTLRNDGWARPFNPRGVELLLRNPRTGAVTRLPARGVDPFQWTPGTTQHLALGMTVPGDIAPGDYELLIALPDPAPRLHDDPRYAIRPANADDPARAQGWDDALGAFRLGTRVRVEHRPH